MIDKETTQHRNNFKPILKLNNNSHSPNYHESNSINSNKKNESIVLNDLESGVSGANNYTIVDETTSIATASAIPVAASAAGAVGSASGGAKSKKKKSVENSSSSGRVSKLDSPNCEYVNSSSTSVEYKPSKTDNIYRFYITRIKHSLIISFLLLIPIQNLVLCVISQLSEQVITLTACLINAFFLLNNSYFYTIE